MAKPGKRATEPLTRLEREHLMRSIVRALDHYATGYLEGTPISTEEAVARARRELASEYKRQVRQAITGNRNFKPSASSLGPRDELDEMLGKINIEAVQERLEREAEQERRMSTPRYHPRNKNEPEGLAVYDGGKRSLGTTQGGQGISIRLIGENERRYSVYVDPKTGKSHLARHFREFDKE